jgi:IclR helix-turn-helix domain
VAKNYVQEFQAAVQASRLPSAARGLLLGMAVWADYATGEITTGYTRSLTAIVAATGLPRSTVTEYLDRLEETGWIIRHVPTLARSRAGDSTWYELTIGKPDLPERYRASRVAKKDRPSPLSGPDETP